MTKTAVKIKLQCQFSGATDCRNLEVSPENLKKIKRAHSKGIVISETSNNIRWDWKVKEVEILSQQN